MICSSVNRARFICPSLLQGRTLNPSGGKSQWQVTFLPEVEDPKIGAFIRFESKQPLWKRNFVLAEIIGGQSNYANGLRCQELRPITHARSRARRHTGRRAP
jgi:hypothetical protein